MEKFAKRIDYLNKLKNFAIITFNYPMESRINRLICHTQQLIKTKIA